ncbi:hypothetical protein ACFLYB_06655 [Chloroflexota bacterium]
MENNEIDIPDDPKDKINKEELIMKAEAHEEKKKTDEDNLDIEKNPDIEDPRLYSPLQEPDIPHPSERIAEENTGEDSDSDLSSS